MKKTVHKPTLKIAFCAVIAALEVVLMMITTFIPVGTYALPCFAGALTVAVVIEFGAKWATGVFFVSSVLSFFLSGDKEAVILFIALFGYYPILKKIIESRLKNKIIQYIIKFVLFNVAAISSFFVAMYVLSVPAEEFTIGGVYVPYLFLIAGNLFFLLYDFMLMQFVRMYAVRIRKAIFGRIL